MLMDFRGRRQQESERRRSDGAMRAKLWIQHRLQEMMCCWRTALPEGKVGLSRRRAQSPCAISTVRKQPVLQQAHACCYLASYGCQCVQSSCTLAYLVL